VPRHVNLRQIEAFKALMEHGTVSRAAQMMNVSQPAMSKAIANLEFDTGLSLFDRKTGRLAPTANATRLFEKVERIFAGVRQVEDAIEAIRREEQGQLTVGVMPAFAGSLIQRVTMDFLEQRSEVFCSVQSLGSHAIIDWLVNRKLDIGLVEQGFANPYLTFEPVMEHPLVCIMPLGHVLSDKETIQPQDFEGRPIVALNPDSFAGMQVQSMFDGCGVRPEVVLIANLATTLCEFVSAGLGLGLVHPLVVSGLEDRLVVRRFEPEIMINFQLCRSLESSNARLIERFAQQLKSTAEQISASMLR
jgi:DNA-binding transcriptional LysR family regulator